MAKLTLTQETQLKTLLANIEWTQDFIEQANVVVGRVGRADDVGAYVPNGESAPECYDFPSIRPITKDIGSPLVGLITARRQLKAFLATHTAPRPR